MGRLCSARFLEEIEAGPQDTTKRHRPDQAAPEGCRGRPHRANEAGEQKMTAKIEVHESSGNIFADLGLPAADSHFLKAQIVAELYRLTNARKLTQDKAGEIMGISQPEVSRLFKGNFREYSIE